MKASLQVRICIQRTIPCYVGAFLVVVVYFINGIKYNNLDLQIAKIYTMKATLVFLGLLYWLYSLYPSTFVSFHLSINFLTLRKQYVLFNLSELLEGPEQLSLTIN